MLDYAGSLRRQGQRPLAWAIPASCVESLAPGPVLLPEAGDFIDQAMLLSYVRLDKEVPLEELPEQVLVAHQVRTSASTLLIIEIRHVIEDRYVDLEQHGVLASHQRLGVLQLSRLSGE